MKTMLALVCAATVLALAASVPADDELGTRATWKPQTRQDVRTMIDQWLANRNLSELERLKLDTLWPSEASPASGDELLDNVAITLSLLAPETKEIVDLCRGERTSPIAPEVQLLSEGSTPEFVRNNLRLLYGRWLVQNDLHDEAVTTLDGLELDSVVDPASLLFYRSVAHHGLLNKEKTSTAISASRRKGTATRGSLSIALNP